MRNAHAGRDTWLPLACSVGPDLGDRLGRAIPPLVGIIAAPFVYRQDDDGQQPVETIPVP